MMTPFWEVVAFTNRLFAGNPAGVCILPEGEWWPDELMQQVAAENNLAETAFLIPRGEFYDLRWLTPTLEVDLCGHATLAVAHVIFEHLGHKTDVIRFQSKSGELTVERVGKRLILDFPARPGTGLKEVPADLTDALGARPVEVLSGRDYIAIFESEDQVSAIKPSLAKVARLSPQGVAVTAPGKECDFVSRYFAPKAGIPEDPVTGSTHCVLIPYWSARTGKRHLQARQISPRGGELFCENRGDRVGIGGNAVTYVQGMLNSGL